jgi:regulatory protein
VNVHIDGAYSFSLAAILAAKLKVGQELAPETIASIQDQDLSEQAYQQAIRYLGFRTRSEAELRQYLRKHKVPEDVLERTMHRLRANQLADDFQFARDWVENRNTFRPRGQRALAWELQRKGVPTGASQAALAGLDEPALAYQAGSRKARLLGSLPWIEFRNRLYGFLARRGFAHATIAPVVSRLWHETRVGQPTSDNEVTP